MTNNVNNTDDLAEQDLLTTLTQLRWLLEGLVIISNDYNFDSSREANAMIVAIDVAVEKSISALELADKQEMEIAGMKALDKAA